MPQDEAQAGGESDGYYVLSEEAIELLPAEWRNGIQAKIDDRRSILKSVDDELTQLFRLSNSIVTMVTLKHVHQRLTEYRFSADMEAILELNMLTTAFVVTYVRLHQGGNGSGFARKALPEKLRTVHDDIIALRNKRFAHDADHDSVSGAMEVEFADDHFEISPSMSLGFHIGGATEWRELVEVVDNLIADRCNKLLDRMRDKTGHNWVLHAGPGPTKAV